MHTCAILHDLRAQGFELSIHGDSLRVTPRERITDATRAILRQHKAELLAAVATVQSCTALEDTRRAATLAPKPAPLRVTVHTPAGNPLAVEARDAEHAAWLRRMNPPPRPANEDREGNSNGR